MTSFPRIRLELSGVEVIDFKTAQREIRIKYGRDYHRSEDALGEAAARFGRAMSVLPSGGILS